MFKEIKNRDAWSTIRGYVYQVDVTILRWIELKDNELLELERGEDIDIVHKDLKNNEISRELEQLKYRESNVSLNQDQTLEILLNCFIHKCNNPSKNLVFRFITNAAYATERPAIFPDGKKGIDVWMNLFCLPEIQTNNEYYIAIKNHLLKKIVEKINFEKSEKEETNENSYWIRFKNYLQHDENLINFITNFEFSGKFDDHERVPENIKESLVRKNLVANYEDAKLAYSNLFLYVFKLLTNHGIKQVTPNELVSKVSFSNYNEQDKQLLITINTLLNLTNERIESIEKKVRKNAENIASLSTEFYDMVKLDNIFDYKLKTFSLKPPALVKNGSLRKQKIEFIKELFTSFAWIHIQGINGTGKSQLAAQLSLEFKNFWWLDLRPYLQDPQKSTALIEAFLSKISNTPVSNYKEDWINDVIHNVPPKTVIVLNDTPNLHNNHELIELLIIIINKIQNTEIKLVTTSNYKITKNLTQSINSNYFYVYQDLDLSDDELIEFLVNSGADNSVLNYIGFINALTNRNASLTGAIVQHLKSVNWGIDSGVLLDVILKREFSKEILEDAQESIKKYVIDQNTRELLYRLSLIDWDFTRKDIYLISEVNKRIEHPNEKFLDLVNVWVQIISDNVFQTSPLIYNLGELNLSEDVIKNVHLAMAKSILSNKKLDQINTTRCITSFIKAKDFNYAGIILLNLYRSATSLEEIKTIKNWGFLSYWVGLPIPKEMGVILRAYIRIEQIRLNIALGEATEHLYNDIVSFLNDEGNTVSQTTLLHFICVSQFESNSSTSSLFHIEEILSHWKQIDEPIKQVITSEVFIGILWVISKKLKQQSDIEKWIEFISIVEKEFNVDFFENENAQILVTFLSRTIVNSNLNRNENDNNWETGGKTLEFLAKYFNDRNQEVLEALVYKEFIVLEFNINKHNALDFSKKLINEYSLSVAKYLIYDGIGKLLYINGNIDESLNWLTSAIELDCRNHIDFTETLVYGASAVSKSNSSKAVEYCELAVTICNEIEEFSELECIQLLSELGVAYWLNNQKNKSFETFEKVVVKLLDLKNNQFDKKWIRLFGWIGHSLSYISIQVSNRDVPEKLEDGSDYVKPYQGIFTFNNKDLSDLYEPDKDSIIYVYLAFFAEGVDDISKAYKWSLNAFDLARKIGNQQYLNLVSSVCSQYSLINFKVDEALEVYLLNSLLYSHSTGTLQERYERSVIIDIQKIYNSKPSKNWNVAEDTTVTFLCIPLFIIVLEASLADNCNKEKYAEAFFNMLAQYGKNASDPNLWHQLFDICQRITNHTITKQELVELSNKFGELERKNLQIISKLGIIYSSNSGSEIIIQIIEIFSYLTKIYGSNSKSVIKYILIPFVKRMAIYALKKEFIGNKIELNTIIHNVENKFNEDTNCIQLILQLIVNELEIKVEDNRKPWLYEFINVD